MFCRPVILCVLNVIIETIRTASPADTFLEGETIDKVH